MTSIDEFLNANLGTYIAELTELCEAKERETGEPVLIIASF